MAQFRFQPIQAAAPHTHPPPPSAPSAPPQTHLLSFSFSTIRQHPPLLKEYCGCVEDSVAVFYGLIVIFFGKVGR